MPFNSLLFCGFISTIFLIYPRLRLRGQNIFLLALSYVFYGYWDWRFTLPLFTSTVVDFWVGHKLTTSGSQKRKKLLLLVSVAINLGILGFFKYFNFFIDSAGTVLTAIGFEPHLPLLRVLLPIGISFYTFKTLSYTIEIYRGRLTPTKSFVEYALFVAFFPQLLAGPIERAANLLPQISSQRHLTREKLLTGLSLVLLGFFKKVAIADTLAPIVDGIFASPQGLPSGQLWTGLYAYSLQIYGDFSGYTDIARGLALMLGFQTMENFNAPYFSRNITEFWRRWHISLSTWLRDYLYISLGGNRRGSTRTYVNLMTTMLLCGLWHGAAWSFVLWGLLHGFYLMVDRIALRGKKPSFAWPHTPVGWATDFLKILFTFHLVALGWILFRSPDLSTAVVYMGGLFNFRELAGISPAVLFAGSLVIALDGMQTLSGSHTWLTDHNGLPAVRYAIIGCLMISVLAATIAHFGTVTPFIYFQF